jgi:hypothetical protein
MNLELNEEYGAGFEGTPSLLYKYIKDTPGQRIQHFKKQMKQKTYQKESEFEIDEAMEPQNTSYGYYGTVDVEKYKLIAYKEMADTVLKIVRAKKIFANFPNITSKSDEESAVVKYLDSKHGRNVAEGNDSPAYIEKDFTKLVQSQDVVSGLNSNMSGAYSYMGGAYSNINGFDYTPIDLGTSIFNTTPATTTTTPVETSTTTSGSNKISAFEKYLLLGQGLFSDYTKMKENEAKIALANASVELETIKSQNGTGGTKDDEFNATPIYVVLGLVGIGLLGFLTYKMVKK